MRHRAMISAAALAVATALFVVWSFCSPARAEDLYWVVGNRASAKCEIVTSNPVILGDIWFADGPYRSRADAKLARSTIAACPKPESDDKD